jgi:tripartite-type tricarboxylate transporter receptor subunit TctC
MNLLAPLRRRGALALVGAALLSTTLAPALAAEAWPAHPVRIIVPFAPGGGADSSARVLADVMGPQLGQSIVVENKPGAGSAIGVMAALQAKDGHTLLMGSNSMVINPSLNPALTYDVARDFDAIGMVSAQPLVLVVPASSRAHTVDQLLALARANPHTPLSAGNSGAGTLAHIASEIFAGQTGIAITPVAYKGESALLPDLVAGRVSLGFLNLPSVLSQIRSGRLRALAVSSPQPLPELPGVPTFRALHYPALEVEGWAALLAAKGSIPPAGLARLDTLLQQALRSDTVRKRFANIGVMPVIRGRAETAKFLQDEAARYAAVIKARGIKTE